MDLAVNYSLAAERLLLAGRVAFDRFKLPAWPDLAKDVSARHRTHVHLPLTAGAWSRGVLDGETGKPPDWARVDQLLSDTDTALVNIHLTPTPAAHPGLDPTATDDRTQAVVAENLLRAVLELVGRYGRERVIAENDPDNGESMRAGLMPEVISRVIEEAGCGLLLDLAHVRITAAKWGTDPRAYALALPVHRLREVHISGVQRLSGAWAQRLRESDERGRALLARLEGELIDHLPMTPEDWRFVTWAFGQIRDSRWRRPEVVTFEYGGIGGHWEAVTQESALAEQIPQLRKLVTRADDSAQNVANTEE